MDLVDEKLVEKKELKSKEEELYNLVETELIKTFELNNDIADYKKHELHLRPFKDILLVNFNPFEALLHLSYNSECSVTCTTTVTKEIEIFKKLYPNFVGRLKLKKGDNKTSISLLPKFDFINFNNSNISSEETLDILKLINIHLVDRGSLYCGEVTDEIESYTCDEFSYTEGIFCKDLALIREADKVKLLGFCRLETYTKMMSDMGININEIIQSNSRLERSREPSVETKVELETRSFFH